MLMGVIVTITWEQRGQPDDLSSVLIALLMALVSLVLASLVLLDRSRRSLEDPREGESAQSRTREA